jgi:hypothetical protein
MTGKAAGKPQVTPDEPEHMHNRRDPEERPVQNVDEFKDQALDKTLADSFPTSDPPSSLPDPTAASAGSLKSSQALADELVGLPSGSWAALSVEERRLIGRGATRDEAIEDARSRGHSQISLVQVGNDAEAPGQIARKAS